jgi:nicotinamidase/pyrazinamidase
MEKDRIICLNGNQFNSRFVASLDVDSQCGFSELCPKELPVPGALEIVPELNKQAELARIRVASRDAHPTNPLWAATLKNPQLSKIEGHKDLDVRWNLHCVVGTKGFEFLPGLDEKFYDFIAYKGIELDKHPYGACYHDLAKTKSTGLIEFLLANNITTIITGGLATSYCFKITVLELCQLKKFKVFVNLAACRDIPGTDTGESIDEMVAAGAEMLKCACDKYKDEEHKRLY